MEGFDEVCDVENDWEMRGVTLLSVIDRLVACESLRVAVAETEPVKPAYVVELDIEGKLDDSVSVESRVCVMPEKVNVEEFVPGHRQFGYVPYLTHRPQSPNTVASNPMGQRLQLLSLHCLRHKQLQGRLTFRAVP